MEVGNKCFYISHRGTYTFQDPPTAGSNGPGAENQHAEQCHNLGLMVGKVETADEMTALEELLGKRLKA